MGIDLAKDAVVSRARGLLENLAVEASRETAPARARGDDDPIDIDEALEAGAEPEKIRAVVIGVLIEREQQRIRLADPRRQKRLRHDMPQARLVERAELDGMGVVEREQGLARRAGAGQIRQANARKCR